MKRSGRINARERRRSEAIQAELKNIWKALGRAERLVDRRRTLHRKEWAAECMESILSRVGWLTMAMFRKSF
jgi:hypothetical protein